MLPSGVTDLPRLIGHRPDSAPVPLPPFARFPLCSFHRLVLPLEGDGTRGSRSRSAVWIPRFVYVGLRRLTRLGVGQQKQTSVRTCASDLSLVTYSLSFFLSTEALISPQFLSFEQSDIAAAALLLAPSLRPSTPRPVHRPQQSRPILYLTDSEGAVGTSTDQ